MRKNFIVLLISLSHSEQASVHPCIADSSWPNAMAFGVAFFKTKNGNPYGITLNSVCREFFLRNECKYQITDTKLSFFFDMWIIQAYESAL